MTTARKLDLITMGRAIVDVYGDQVGCGLEDVASFSRYAGGCPTNIAIGTSSPGFTQWSHHARWRRAERQVFRTR